MPQSLANILVHLIFSTKDRVALIHQDVEEELYRYLAVVARQAGCPAIKVGGADDHVHLLGSLGRTVSVADVVESVKARRTQGCALGCNSAPLRGWGWGGDMDSQGCALGYNSAPLRG